MSNIIEIAKQYMYNSLEHIDDNDLAGASVFAQTEDSLLVYKETSGVLNVYWAAQEKDQLITKLRDFIGFLPTPVDGARKVHIAFIPKNFVADLEKLGFQIECEWMDFWIADLASRRIEKENRYIIRPLAENECSRAGEITRMCSGSSRGFRGESDQWVMEWKAADNSEVFAAIEDNRILGVCFVNLYGFDSEKGTVLWLREVAVDPSYQRKGIGRALMNHALQWGIENGARRSFLACDSDNRNAIALYESLGYRCNPDQSEINMELKLRRI